MAASIETRLRRLERHYGVGPGAASASRRAASATPRAERPAEPADPESLVLDETASAQVYELAHARRCARLQGGECGRCDAAEAIGEYPDGAA